jgi:glycosyltransferase involved in cell wall biosynthesis
MVWPIIGRKDFMSIGTKLVPLIQQHRRIKSASFAFAGHPMPTTVLRESKFLFASGEGALRETVLPREREIPVISPILDCVLTLIFLVRNCRQYDMYISAGLHMVLLGILLRRLGVVKQAVGMSTDYFPQRYRSSVLSRLHRSVSSWCSTHLDFVVNGAPTTNEARLRDGIRVDPAKQFTVTHPIDQSEIGSLPQEQLEPDSLIWSGMATLEYGFDLVIEAMELVVRERPSAIVNVTSYAKFPDHLWKIIVNRGLENNFRLLGFIKDETEFRNVVRRNRVGLAPYQPTTSTQKRYTSVSRAWLYMATGVPPIITRVPPDAAEIEQAGAGIVIDYDREQLANAILALLNDDQLHQRCRQKGLELVSKRTTDKVFRDLFTRLGIPPDSQAMAAHIEQ